LSKNTANKFTDNLITSELNPISQGEKMKLKVKKSLPDPTDDGVTYALSHQDAETMEEMFRMIENTFWELLSKRQLPTPGENIALSEDREF
jgi:hypothetical protein